MAETLIGLVSQYSPSGQEQGAAEWLVGRMKTLGYNKAFIDGSGNATGMMGAGPRQVVLLGHIDTVPGEIPLRVEDGILYGRGAVDAKGPLACFTDAVAKVGAVEGWQFVVIGAVEEERDSSGTRFIVDQYKPDFTIIGEPNRWDRVALGYKGSALAEITLRREQAHSASGGQTACEAVIEIWLSIQAFAASFNAKKQRAFDKVLPTLRAMRSGKNEFKQWARLQVGARLPLDLSPEQWYARLDTIATNAKVTQVGYAIPAWACEKKSRLVRTFLSGIRSQGGVPFFVYKTGTADLNIVAPVWQCPALVYGPGDSALDHTPAEQLSLQEYQKAVNVLAMSLQQLTQQA
ncbi:MAG: LysW-gamma-L-lysine carboxypeptidase [Chloroflexi bacterium]|nr:MAG: LysW-gamma-L-lysine carboxypeptidase [Chloroflexota bacterium]